MARASPLCGITRFFGVADIGKRGLVRGCSEPEEAHVWNDGPDAQLLMTLNPPSRTCTLMVEGKRYIRGNHRQQEVTLFANGLRMGYWLLIDNGFPDRDSGK
jgi:hypothetical protein